MERKPRPQPQNRTSSSPTTRRSPSQRDLSIAGWRSKSAVLVGVSLAVLGATGLWTWLGPFSVGAQLAILLHTVLGVAILVPTLTYALRHLLTWWRQKPTAAMILGYALLVTVLVSLVTGVVVTWQGFFGPRLSPTWDLVHLVAGIGAFGLVVTHVLVAFFRRRLAARRDEEVAGALAGFWRRVGVAAAAPAAVVVLGAAIWPRPQLRYEVPEDYSLPAYAQEFDEYRNNPFAPTYARTDDLRLVAPRLLAGSESCGTAGCHEEIVDEWEPSAHRFSAMNDPFQAVQQQFAADREPAETRYCAGCHDPISLFAGAKDIHNQNLSAPGVDEGISCAACHSIAAVDERGNADYVVEPPELYIGELGDGRAAKLVSDFLIRAYPRQHLADYDRPVLKSPELCGACHKQFIPEALNRFGMVEGQNQYDEWKNAHWHSDDPEVDLSCRDCHMRLVSDSRDPGKGEGGDVRRNPDDGAHRHHGFIATNNFMPEALDLPHWEEQVALTEEWMRGETVLPEIAHLWPEGPVASLDFVAPDSAAPGEEVAVRVLVTNRKAGHNFVTGPLDFVRSWIHLRVRDGSGRIVAEWGALDPETRRILDEEGVEHRIGNPRDSGTLVLEALPVDERGEELLRHELWNKAGGKGKRVVFPTYSDAHLYRFEVPDGAVGPLTLEADLNFRRYRQEFLDLVVPNLEESTGVRQPTVTQTTATAVLDLVPSTTARVGG